jgi:hypothetical protein
MLIAMDARDALWFERCGTGWNLGRRESGVGEKDLKDDPVRDQLATASAARHLHLQF